MAILSYESVSFRYRRLSHDVLDAFSWQVPTGRTVLLGPNGAGKSTLLALGAGALSPRRGQVLIDGQSRKKIPKQVVGWMPQHSLAVPGLTVGEQIQLAGWMQGLSDADARRATQVAAQMVDLEDLLGQQAASLSGGQVRRLGLAQSLVAEPKIILLDEPTVGLDPGQRSRFRGLLANLPLEMAVLVSTHQIDDLEDTFDTVVVINRGALTFEGAVTDFLLLGEGRNPAERAERAYSKLVAEAER